MVCLRLMLAGKAIRARPVGVITWEVEGVDVWARFACVARVFVGSGRCLATTGSCPVQVVALGGAVQIVAGVALETAAGAATGTRTVLVLWADCIDAILRSRLDTHCSIEQLCPYTIGIAAACQRILRTEYRRACVCLSIFVSSGASVLAAGHTIMFTAVRTLCDEVRLARWALV